MVQLRTHFGLAAAERRDLRRRPVPHRAGRRRPAIQLTSERTSGEAQRMSIQHDAPTGGVAARTAIRRGFTDAIGDTPLIRLNRFSEETGCEILGKAEFMNPGGSVKDRAALGIIEDAERSGRLKAGGTVVEGTAGNTGIGLAHVCNVRGYRCIVVMPDNQSPEKHQTIETLGAEVLRVKTVPYSDPNHYQKIAGRLAQELPDAIWANQFDNTANRDVHERTTGPEIWAQTGGRIDAFVAATGTGGTLGGVSRFLRRQANDRGRPVQVVLADPQGSSLYHWLRHGELKATGASSITEGIGIGRVTANL